MYCFNLTLLLIEKIAHRSAKESALEIFKKKAIGDVSKDHLEELNKKMKTRVQ